MTEPTSLPADTSLGAVRLRVRNLAQSRHLYESILGLRARPMPDGDVALHVGDAVEPILFLHEDRSARKAEPSSPGLYHVAILVPTRVALGEVLLRLRETGWPIQGAADHLVSEALYLADPDGIGIEIYRDRPRSDWKWVNGEVSMATRQLDVKGVLDAASNDNYQWKGLSPGTRIGHIHLQVSDLVRAERFYHKVIGFNPTARGYPQALFLSAGGYHHHVAVNTWQTSGAPRPTEPIADVIEWTLRIPDIGARVALLQRAQEVDALDQTDPVESVVIDPDGIRLVIEQ